MTHAEAYDTVSTHDGTVRQPRAFHRPGPRSPGIVRAIRFYHIVMFLLSLRRDTLRGTFIGRHDRAKTGGASSYDDRRRAACAIFRRPLHAASSAGNSSPLASRPPLRASRTFEELLIIFSSVLTGRPAASSGDTKTGRQKNCRGPPLRVRPRRSGLEDSSKGVGEMPRSLHSARRRGKDFVFRAGFYGND